MVDFDQIPLVREARAQQWEIKYIHFILILIMLVSTLMIDYESTNPLFCSSYKPTIVTYPIDKLSRD